MKVIRFGIDDDTYDELQSTADDKKMSVVSLMAYVIGTFLWAVRHITSGYKIVALDADNEVIDTLNIWENDKDDT